MEDNALRSISTDDMSVSGETLVINITDEPTPPTPVPPAPEPTPDPTPVVRKIKTYMFNNWASREGYIPNNMFKLGDPPDGVRDIIRGTTPEHFIHLPFDIIKDVRKLEITYKQDQIATIVKTLDDISVYDKSPSTVYFQFTEDETNKFKEILNRPVQIQVRAWLTNKDVVTSDIYMIRALDVLNDDKLNEESK